jgi:hypothetical protein
MADMKLLQEKLKMWKGKLKQYEDELADIMIRRGDAIKMGDLRENAAFQMLDEDKDTWRVKIEEVKKIIRVIEKDIEEAK